MLKNIAIAGAVLLGLFILLVVVVGLTASEDTSTSDDPFPSVPTSTPVGAPTATPRPTPTPAPAPCTSAEEQEYREALGMRGVQMAISMGELSEQLVSVESNPLLMFDEDWLTDVGLALVGMKVYADEMAALDAPPSLQRVDPLVDALTAETNQYIGFMAQGLDNMDVGAVEAANDSLGRIPTHIANITAEIERVCGPL